MILGSLLVLRLDGVLLATNVSVIGTRVPLTAHMSDLLAVRLDGHAAVSQPEVGRPGHDHRQDGNQTDKAQRSIDSTPEASVHGCGADCHLRTIRESRSG